MLTPNIIIKMTVVEVKCIDGYPYNTTIKIDNKLIENAVILRYKEVLKEKQLIIVTCDNNAQEHQQLFNNKNTIFNFHIKNKEQNIEIKSSKKGTSVFYKYGRLRYRLKKYKSFLWQLEIPDLSTIELVF